MISLVLQDFCFDQLAALLAQLLAAPAMILSNRLLTLYPSDSTKPDVAPLVDLKKNQFDPAANRCRLISPRFRRTIHTT